MDELKDKLKKLSLFGSKGSSSKSAFKGTGHRLGGGPSQAGAPAAGQRPAATAVPRRPALVVPPPPQPQPQPSQQPTAASALPAAPAQPAQATAPPQHAQQQQQQQRLAAPQPQRQQQALAQPSDDAPEEVVLAVGQLASDPGCAASAEVLTKLLRNIVAAPTESKFRRVRLSNPRIEAAVVHCHGGVELLLACGFEIVFEEGATEGAAAAGGGGGTTEGYAVLADDADVAPLQHAVQLLAPLLPAQAGTAPAAPSSSTQQQQQQQAQQQQQQVAQPRPPKPPREWAASRERSTQVLLPTSVERDVPEWFFQRTGADLKAAFAAAVRRRENDQVLMTRATKERLRSGGAGSGPAPKYATIRVRFPEGISLQGEFNAGEPVAAVFGWVADCLSDPLHTYELVLPSRQPLEVKAQSVREADLLPSVALLFRWTGQSAVEMAHMPALRPELLRTARPAIVSY